MIGGFKEGLKASSRRPPTTPRRRTHHLLGRCRAGAPAPNFADPQHIPAQFPCELRRGDQQIMRSTRARSVVQSGALDWRVRAGLGTALIGEGHTGVDAYLLAPVEIRHARVLGEGVVSGRRRSLTAQAAPSAVHASTAAAALRRLDPHDVSFLFSQNLLRISTAHWGNGVLPFSMDHACP